MDFLVTYLPYLPYLPYLTALGGLLVGGLLTWLIYRNRVTADRVRRMERARTAEKAIVDLEAGSANLEAELQQYRHTESALLKRQGELEMLLKTQRKALEDVLLRDVGSKITSPRLHRYLDELQVALGQLSNAISETYFK